MTEEHDGQADRIPPSKEYSTVQQPDPTSRIGFDMEWCPRYEPPPTKGAG